MINQQSEFRQYYSENLWLYIQIKITGATQMFTGKPFLIQLNEKQKNSFVDLFRGKSDKKREQSFYNLFHSRRKKRLRYFIDSVETTRKRKIPKSANRIEFRNIYFTPNSCVTELSYPELVSIRKKMAA